MHTGADSRGSNTYGYSSDKNVAIVTTLWHSELVEQMYNDALLALHSTHNNTVRAQRHVVSGTVELAHAAHAILQSQKYDGVIVMGAVIRGETPHFDYVCNIISQAVAILNTSFLSPTIFGVLTVNTLQEAQERVNGENGHTAKGTLDALALLQQFEMQEAI